MNPTLALLLSMLAKLDSKDIAALIAAIVSLLDPIFANKGPFAKLAWSLVKAVLTSGAFAPDVSAHAVTMSASPEVAAASSELLI